MECFLCDIKLIIYTAGLLATHPVFFPNIMEFDQHSQYRIHILPISTKCKNVHIFEKNKLLSIIIATP
jgi:HKD family nuclease